MRVFSPDFEYLYKISSFLRFQEIKKYTGMSILTLVIAATDDVAYYLQKNGWIVTDEPYIIKHIQQDLQEITITAYGGHQLLKQRVTVPATGQYAIELTGSADAVVKHFINQSKRGLPLATAAVQGGVTISDQSRWKNLGDEVERVLIGAGRGEKFIFDADNQRIIFDTYFGVDRSRGNADDNPPVVFDLKYRNISEYTYTEDATVEQTTVYVGGQGEGVDREIIVTGNDADGVERTEVFVDARDVEQGDTAKLTERATQATIPAAQTVSATAVADANLVYGVDYNLGDIVTTNVPVKRYVKSSDYYDPVTETIQVNQRITEVTITRENGAEHIDLTFGDQPITQTQIQRLRAEIAQLKSVEVADTDFCLNPTGAVQMFAGSAAPTGWLLCDGAAVSRTTYAALYAVIGTTFGAGDGSTTFNVPNLKGRVVVGCDASQSEFDTLGETGGAKTQSFGSSALSANLNMFLFGGRLYIDYARANSSYTENERCYVGATDVGKETNRSEISDAGIAITGNTDSGSILQPYIVLNYIIKI
jgi:microcystin-dependent protein